MLKVKPEIESCLVEAELEGALPGRNPLPWIRFHDESSKFKGRPTSPSHDASLQAPSGNLAQSLNSRSQRTIGRQRA